MAEERILIVDDDEDILLIVQTILANAGYSVLLARNGREGVDLALETRPDLVLLDVMMPELSGWEVCTTLKNAPETRLTPIAMMTVKSEIRDLITGMQVGADDYLTKPFSVDELLARVRVVLRHAARPATGAAPIFRTGELVVDLEHRLVTVSGREVRLTPTEYDLLRAFLAHPNKVLTATMLLRAVWGADYGSEAHYLHVYVARLRRKLEPDPRSPRYLRTEPGVGYRLVVEESPAPATSN
jgi:two-component system KDP operon response regulator KdpE